LNTKSSKSSNFGGWSLYLIFILAIIILWWSAGNDNKPTNMTKAEFVAALQAGQVDAVKISQNAEVPTGNLTILMKDESTRTMYVSDVNEMQKVMEDNGFGNFYCINVPQKSWLESFLPYLIIFGCMFIFFMIMNNNAAQQGGGSKMMNFGKSRAKLATDEKGKKTFENVAGPLVDNLLGQIGTPPPPQRPVGGNPGASIGAPTGPTVPEDNQGNVVFNDLGPVSWAQEAITYLAEHGIVAGRGNGIFAPNDGVTREEMVKLVVTAFSDTNSGAECDFSDVSTDRWSYPYIATAFNLGLITGVDASNFEPTGSITRENLAVILYRTYNYAGKKVVAENASYTDSENISSYAKDAVNAMAKLGIMEGMGDGTFSPKTVVTRAQAAKVIYSLITLIGGNI